MTDVPIFSFGMSGPFNDWVETATIHLLQLGGASVSLRPVNTLADLGEAVATVRESFLVAGLRQAGGPLRQALTHSPRRRIVCLEDPVHAALHIMQRHGPGLAAAVRAVANSCAMLGRFAQQPGVLLLRASEAVQDPAGTLLRLAEFLGTPVGADSMPAVAAGAGTEAALASLRELSAGPQQPPCALQPIFDALDEHDQAVLLETLGSYRAVLEGRPDGLIWPRSLFVAVDAQADGPAQLVDIAGAPRCLIYGPYLPVPAGSWRARVVIGFSAETSGIRFAVDVTAGKVLAQASVRPRGEEVRETEIKFDRDEDDEMVEVRIFTEDAALEGHIALGFITLSPEPPPLAEPPSSLLQPRRRPPISRLLSRDRA